MTKQTFEKSKRTEAEWQAFKPYMDELVGKHKTADYIQNDPIQIPHRFIENPIECELVAFITALLSYGRRPLIIQTVHQLLQTIDNDPLGFLNSFNARKDAKRFQHFRYRFNKGEDIVYLWQRLQWVYQEYGSLENLFLSLKSSTESLDGSDSFSLKETLIRFMTEISGELPLKTNGLKFLLGHPGSGGASKRLNMFLRWMVRQDEEYSPKVDLGLWRNAILPSDLMIPLDTHVMKMNKVFGFSTGNTPSWKTAAEITRIFQLFCPEDPVRYDYALMGLSLEGGPPENEIFL